VFFTFAIFQACIDRVSTYCLECDILDFKIEKNWNKNDTIKIQDFWFGLDASPFWQCEKIICLNNRLINSCIANNANYYAEGKISYIGILCNKDLDSMHPAGTLLNDKIILNNYDIESKISDMVFPINTSQSIFFEFVKEYNIDTIIYTQFTIIYEEIDGTKITKVLPEVYISPNLSQNEKTYNYENIF
jgi:hypothetical protein